MPRKSSKIQAPLVSLSVKLSLFTLYPSYNSSRSWVFITSLYFSPYILAVAYWGGSGPSSIVRWADFCLSKEGIQLLLLLVLRICSVTWQRETPREEGRRRDCLLDELMVLVMDRTLECLLDWEREVWWRCSDVQFALLWRVDSGAWLKMLPRLSARGLKVWDGSRWEN